MKIPFKYTAPILGLALAATSANAAIVFFDDFESPVVQPTHSSQNTSQQIDTAKWVLSTQGFAGNRSGIVHVDEDGGAGYIATPTVGSQVWAGRYRVNPGVTTAFGTIGSLSLGQIITITFDATRDGYMEIEGNAGDPANGTNLQVFLMTYNDDPNADPAVFADRTEHRNQNAASGILAQLTNTSGAVDDTWQTFSFSYTVDGDTDPALLGQDIALRFGQGTYAAIDNVSVSIIPEPTTALLGGLGLLALLRRRR